MQYRKVHFGFSRLIRILPPSVNYRCLRMTTYFEYFNHPVPNRVVFEDLCRPHTVDMHRLNAMHFLDKFLQFQDILIHGF